MLCPRGKTENCAGARFCRKQAAKPAWFARAAGSAVLATGRERRKSAQDPESSRSAQQENGLLQEPVFPPPLHLLPVYGNRTGAATIYFFLIAR